MAESPDIVDLTITNVAHGGVFVARHEGRVIFVPDTIPGEVVRARIVDTRKKSFWRAETLEVLEASPDRVEHVWSAASIDRDPGDRAGGAEFGHIALPAQRRLKGEVLSDALVRFGGLDESVPATRTVVEPTPGDANGDGRGWRTRVSLHVDDEGRVGPYAVRSHRVIPVDDLPLASPAVAEAAPLHDRLEGSTTVDVVQSSDAVIVAVDGVAGGGPLREVVGDRTYTLDPLGFWQVHREAASVLAGAVAGAVDPARFDPSAPNLDLYGGVGLFAGTLADRFGRDIRITTVESESSATDHAAENLADVLGGRAVTARVDRFLRQIGGDAGTHRYRDATIVLDPPRSGAGTAVVRSVTALAPAQIVYVACDPVALARDTRTLGEDGYELVALRAFDLFPHTHHVEAVATFVRAGNGRP
ncbi:class I SAM-dependent RNA methyltransferase [Labedella endophytica]|uniref:Class I SAM-dependent RNA methyltransferase n=1 Tax=Labedella endophytica TaxID=1523160 RepID=A0A3S0VB87_9MICO|nr:TRAM domain-containing protein [Labedella endophytica]RUR01353.1 class I SAM-dependent RNA methyltransferase [Labedella endophytica]